MALLELTSCDSAVLWHYLTSLHDQRRAVSWIDGKGEASGDPRWPELIPELVSGFTACSTYMKENILDLLARYGRHFHRVDQVFFKEFLTNVAHTCCIVLHSQPHFTTSCFENMRVAVGFPAIFGESLFKMLPLIIRSMRR